MKHKVIIVLVGLLLGIDAHASMPEWARINGTKLRGKHLTTVCSGTGPSIDIARGEAIRGCKASASDFMNHSGTVRSMLVESSQNIEFHQSFEQSISFTGLTCEPEREEIEQTDSGALRLWLLCQFDLAKARIGEETPVPNVNHAVEAGSAHHLTALKARDIKPAQEIVSNKRLVLNIASVPSCNKLIVKGSRPRVVTCSGHPASIVIFPEDESLIIEAKGYAPKTLNLKIKQWKNHDSVQVILDAH